MSLSIGIVGLPNVGKSTLFNALTDADALAANYPFATIEPNTGIVPVPDPRLAKLAKIYQTDRVIPATVTFVDIAGLVSGASEGEGLGNQFLGHIRTCHAIAQVIRAFKDENVTNVGTNSNKRDIEIINTELALADLQTLQNRIPKLEKETKSESKLKQFLVALRQVEEILGAGKSVNLDVFKEEVQLYLLDLQLLSLKPKIYVFNIDENQIDSIDQQKQIDFLPSNAETVYICAKLESELKSLDEVDRIELLRSYGQSKSGLELLIFRAQKTLNLQSFLTAGAKEVRAWTIKTGSTAPQAAGVIHSDFERGFIAAQIVNFQDLIEFGSITAAKKAGKVRVEGKSYVMKPDDVVDFKFSV